MPNFDPRTLNKCAFEALTNLRKEHQKLVPDFEKAKKGLKDQKNQAMEIYTYLSTWGLMRLKAEEKAISKEQDERRKVVKSFFKYLQELAERNDLAGDDDLKNFVKLSANEYLGLTGLAIELANEFGFWANAVYHDITGAQ
ncbi:hypothetical protein [Synechocystis sp. PCC 6714]|uniref:hypothetical protein n=1 Tax=Synechocystis sp. (strain PCC 6714) TaxID=1147 RepID=UPI0003FF0A36|nr:hypothetical protein [Synechocystis sp. PCC 6714]AIE76118.1 hypothetical protein D082_40720 [Synechocystis sp. PCC 6714]